MQLQVRPAGDGRTILLTDTKGRRLPGQFSVDWRQDDPQSLPAIVVTFLVDGTQIEVVGDNVETGRGSLPEALEAFALLSDANKLRFIEAARPHPLERTFAKFAAALDTLAEATR